MSIKVDGGASFDDPTPTRKVTLATVGAACATALVIIISWITGESSPTGLEGALATIFTFVFGYFVKETRFPAEVFDYTRHRGPGDGGHIPGTVHQDPNNGDEVVDER
jgi:hypothetical protein